MGGRSVGSWMLVCGLVASAFGAGEARAQEGDFAFEKDSWKGMAWREIGPYRGGRCAAVAGIPSNKDVYYFGAAGGGVWKSEDSGRNWKNVSDGFFGGSIGAVAVSEWDPNVVYVGGGEKTLRGNVSHGDGMWKSTDAGRTWKHVGLPDSRHISRIRIHPKNPDLVYAAVMGHLYGPNEERGVFRSTDGGASWDRVHFVNENAGCVDLAMDPTNPRILYASFWSVNRKPWTLESGGEGSGLWKSTDGGATWDQLSDNEGFPKGTLGIIGITVSPSDPDNLYAIVEAKEGGVYRSSDAGKKWRRTNKERNLRQRAWYYTRIYADPVDANALYVLNVQFHRSVDGGKSFSTIRTPHGDNHDLWIDPADPLRMIQSNDGGANVSGDGGQSWTPQDNQPTAQMYRVSVDDDFPYRLLGGQQDNSALRIRSKSARGRSIGDRDWEPTAGGESGHIVAQPGNPDVVFGGSYGGYLVRLDHRSGERRSVNPWPDNPMGWGAAEIRQRFQWNFPIFFSPHDPKRLYAASQMLHRSDDGGASWTAISGDLTRDDKSKQGPSGGSITKDNTSVEYYCTIFAALESPHEAGVLWCGSDDGLVHVSRNGGESWANVTPDGLPEWAQINSIDAHPSEKSGAYLAATRYKLDDFEPYLYRTLDYGATWKRIDAGIPRDEFTRVVRADPERPGLLYAGTEEGVHVSLDDGASWTSLQLKLPIVPITDLAVKDGDLIAATQGRGFWILDDLSALRQLDLAKLESGFHLFEPRTTVRLIAGGTPPTGAQICYWLGEEQSKAEDLKLEILTSDGTLVRSYTKRKSSGAEGASSGGGRRSRGGDNTAILPVEQGFNRFAWNLSWPAAKSVSGLILWNGRGGGPTALPGTYLARLSSGEQVSETEFVVVADPRSSATDEDRMASFALQMELRDELTRVHTQIERIRDARGQITAIKKRLDSEGPEAELKESADALIEELRTVEETLYQTKNESRQDPLNFPIRLNDKLAGLLGHVRGGGDFAPTRQALEVQREIGAQIDAALQRLDKVWKNALPEFEQAVREAGVPAVRLDEPKKELEEIGAGDGN